jgi:hypothetical protein
VDGTQVYCGFLSFAGLDTLPLEFTFLIVFCTLLTSKYIYFSITFHFVNFVLRFVTPLIKPRTQVIGHAAAQMHKSSQAKINIMERRRQEN